MNNEYFLWGAGKWKVMQSPCFELVQLIQGTEEQGDPAAYVISRQECDPKLSQRAVSHLTVFSDVFQSDVTFFVKFMNFISSLFSKLAKWSCLWSQHVQPRADCVSGVPSSSKSFLSKNSLLPIFTAYTQPQISTSANLFMFWHQKLQEPVSCSFIQMRIRRWEMILFLGKQICSCNLYWTIKRDDIHSSTTEKLFVLLHVHLSPFRKYENQLPSPPDRKNRSLHG